jgi:hypothetical protein
MKTKLYFLIATLLVAFTASAADRYWTNNAGGTFSTALNWSPNIVPGAADNARFTLGMLPTISWSAAHTNAYAEQSTSIGGFVANMVRSSNNSPT